MHRCQPQQCIDDDSRTARTLCMLRAPLRAERMHPLAVIKAVAAPIKPSTLNVAGQDVGPKDAPLPSLFPPEPAPPAPVSPQCRSLLFWCHSHTRTHRNLGAHRASHTAVCCRRTAPHDDHVVATPAVTGDRAARQAACSSHGRLPSSGLGAAAGGARMASMQVALDSPASGMSSQLWRNRSDDASSSKDWH